MYLKKFSWGPTFIEINRDLLDTYATCVDAADVVDKQNKYIIDQKEVKFVLSYINPRMKEISPEI